MKINLIIPAKGTSQRIKNKNLCTINGKSLVRLACEKALRCSNVNEVYLDTESEEIISSVADLEKSGLKIIKRAKELANNDIGANEMMVYGLHSVSDCGVSRHTSTLWAGRTECVRGGVRQSVVPISASVSVMSQR